MVSMVTGVSKVTMGSLSKVTDVFNVTVVSF